MTRILLTCAIVTAVFAAAAAAQAQTTPTKKAKMSPGEMAAHDQMVAEKRAACQQQAKENKLKLLERRKFVKECVAKAVGQ